MKILPESSFCIPAHKESAASLERGGHEKTLTDNYGAAIRRAIMLKARAGSEEQPAHTHNAVIRNGAELIIRTGLPQHVDHCLPGEDCHVRISGKSEPPIID